MHSKHAAMARRRPGGSSALGRASPACLAALLVVAGKAARIEGSSGSPGRPAVGRPTTRPCLSLLPASAGWAIQAASGQALQLQPMAGVTLQPPAAAAAASPPASAPAAPPAGCTCTDQLAPGYPSCQALVSCSSVTGKCIRACQGVCPVLL